MDFKKNFTIANLQIISEPTITYNFNYDFIMIIESKFYREKYGCCLIFGNQCVSVLVKHKK